MGSAMSQLQLSTRTYYRMLKLSRTIADLAEALRASQSSKVDDG